MAGSFAYQKQLVDGEFQPLGVYTNTVDANYVVPADASLIRWNVPAQAAGRSIDFSLIPAGSEVQVEVIDSNVQNVEEVGLVFILNDTAPRVVNIRSVDGAGTVVLSDGTAAEYDIGTSGTTVGLLNANWNKSGTTAFSGDVSLIGADFILNANQLYLGNTSQEFIQRNGFFPGIDLVAAAGVKLSFLALNLFGAADALFQGVAGAGGYSIFEGTQLGLVLSTDSNVPIYVQPNRVTAVAEFATTGTKIGVGGTGGLINAILVGTTTWDPGSTATGTAATTTLTVTGAAVGDVAIPSWEDTTAGWIVTAFVSAANTVTVNALFMGAVSSDPASFTLRAWVIKR